MSFFGTPSQTQQQYVPDWLRADTARQQGFIVRDGLAYKPTTSNPFSYRAGAFAGAGSSGIPLSSFTPPAYQAPSTGDQMRSALQTDVNFLENNVQKPYLDALPGLKNTVEQAPAGVRQMAFDQGEVLGENARQLEATGDDAAERVYGDTDAMLQRIIGGVETGNLRADQAIKLAMAGIKQAESNVGAYNADTNATIGAILAGQAQRMRNQKAMIEAGLRPDGTPMTPAEQDAAMAQIQFEANQSAAVVTSQLRADTDRFMAGLRDAIVKAKQFASGTALEAGKVRQEGARTLIGAQQAGVESRATAERTRLAYREMASNMRQFVATMKNAAEAQAASLEMSGRTAYLDAVRNVPYISMLEGLMAIMSVETAGGGGGSFGGGGGVRTAPQAQTGGGERQTPQRQPRTVGGATQPKQGSQSVVGKGLKNAGRTVVNSLGSGIRTATKLWNDVANTSYGPPKPPGY